ncbi:expressed protein [Phakopsora pachyrhizi]|uniref:Expressed protein n=1 Tax=Phakopsora pachyrhizi TaxID=170000 RepID=A0AAV0AR49_PHAPC|nr:expressed protein [Phakopsora pachyrhizi]
MHEEYSNWAAEDEISPLGEWYNHPDSAPNLEEVMNSYHRDTWNSAPVDHSIFSGQIHQQQTYPHKVSTQDQGSSSNNVQPNYDGDVFGENNGNFVPHFNEFRYPDSSFEHHPHQNIEISHDEQMTQYPAVHSMQNDLSYSPQHSDVGNRGYQNQDWQVSDFNPASSSKNYGSLDTGAAIDHGINSIDNKNLIYDKSKNSMIEEAQPLAGTKYLFTEDEKSELAVVFKKNFRRFSLEEELEYMPHKFKMIDTNYLKKFNEKSVDFINQQVDSITKKNVIEANSAKMIKLRKCMIIDYTFRIDWEGAKALKTKVCCFADNFTNYKIAAKKRGTANHIKRISIWGITFMKIIAKMYSYDPVSEFFERDQSLFNYTKIFWNFCFTNEGKIEELTEFFGSFGKECSEKDTNKIIFTKFLDEHNTPGHIFSRIKQNITGRTEMQVTYFFSWYFVFFRAIVYYPHLITEQSTSSGRYLKAFIEDGIIDFFENGEKVQK